ncbi:MAG TPA: PAS domain S-box protein [bacterium]|nr:PAS domain S-box protein [bacterium]
MYPPGQAQPTPLRRLHSERRARGVDAACGVIAIAGWSAAALFDGTWLRELAIAIATGATTLAAFRPWCRRQARRAVESATWAAEREREHATATATKHVEAWRAIVHTANEGIVTIDQRGLIETVNGAAERLFGYEHGELIGKNVSVLMPEPFSREHDGYLERYLRTGKRNIIGIGREVVGLRKGGEQFPIDLSVGEGAIEGRRFFTAVIRDLTERKELRAKLAQSERLAAVGELAAGVAHEVNNPINTMINCAQLIQDGDAADDNCRIIIQEGSRIADIVRALLQFARDDSDQAEPTALAEAVQRTQRMIGESWKRHGITLEVDVPDDLPPVMARPQKVQQVLLNLLINAKDALLQQTDSARRVLLRAAISSDGKGVDLAVVDNGPGIDASVRDRIFEPFVTTKRARGGTGLGLSISRSIIEDYGGEISVASTPGKGTAFSIWLPIAPRE